jgi:hypothetical protein
MKPIARLRPTPSMVVASIALLVALGGTSVAAVRTLEPANSVGTAQVIDNSLLKKDFKTDQLPAGKQGPAGPSNAFATSADGPITLADTGSTVATLQLTKPGSYVIWGKAFLTSGGSGDDQVQCILTAGDASDHSFAYLPRASVTATISNIVVDKLAAAGTALLACTSSGHTTARSVQLVAIKIGSLASS